MTEEKPATAPTVLPAPAETPEPAEQSEQPITAQEYQHLIDCEHKLANHFASYREAGEALATIRDERLYRVNFPTFETYCRTKWDMTKSQANRLIAAAGVVQAMEKSGSKTLAKAAEGLPEFVVRPLTKLPTQQATEILKRVNKENPGLHGVSARKVLDTARIVVPSAFPKVHTHRNGRNARHRSDLVRKSEIVEAIREWQTAQTRSGKFGAMSASQAVKAIIKVVKSV